ncbi:MAG: hypothetical protein JWN84_3591 [Nocardioides sp.]|nr:hypothetical protein [Nocardioides sp.]
MTIAPDAPGVVTLGGAGADVAGLRRRHDELGRRLGLELRLAEVGAAGSGVLGLVAAIADLTPNPLWLFDDRHRLVGRSSRARGSDFRAPDLESLLERRRETGAAPREPVVLAAAPAHGVVRRHLVAPVVRDEVVFGWIVLAEVMGRLGPADVWLAGRGAFHLASEYAVQRRVAGSSWNARADLARQLVRGTGRQDDIASAADYLGVRVDADRVIVFVADGRDAVAERRVAAHLGRALDVEVLAARGQEGAIVLLEAPDGEQPAHFVQRVKVAARDAVAAAGVPTAVVGVSGVSAGAALKRAYRETREVVQCVDRFAGGADRVIAVDDLGPARLFVANSDVESVRRYVHDVLGALLTGAPGTPDLLRTLQCFFDTGRSVRESSSRLKIHENTVRLRLAKVHDLTGLDVAADAHDQLGAQTALLVLRLEGHPAVPTFDERHAAPEPAPGRRTA